MFLAAKKMQESKYQIDMYKNVSSLGQFKHRQVLHDLYAIILVLNDMVIIVLQHLYQETASIDEEVFVLQILQGVV